MSVSQNWIFGGTASYDDIVDIIQQRIANPIRCDVCSERQGHDVYFEPETLAWYHCPECDGHGFGSVYETTCTDCANRKRGF